LISKSSVFITKCIFDEAFINAIYLNLYYVYFLDSSESEFQIRVDADLEISAKT